MAEVKDNSENVQPKLPVIPAVATAAAPSWTEGRVASLSVDLAGALRTTGGAGPGGGLTDVELRASPVPVSGPLTDAQLRAIPVPVSGTVTATGPLTDTQLRATPVPVSGTVTATGPLTDTQLRASAVPVSGPLTDAQLRATAVPVSGSLTDGGAGKTLKRAVVSLAATGDVVAAVPTKRIKVYQYALQSRADSLTAQFRDGGAGAFLGLRWGINTREGAQGGAVNPPAFVLATTAGNSLQIVIAGGTVDVEVSYWDDDAA